MTSLTCKLCNNNYTLTTDFGSCLPTIVGCSVYTNSIKTQNALQCTTCATNYVLSNLQTCLSVIPNCIKYANVVASNNTSICVTCANGFILNGRNSCWNNI